MWQILTGRNKTFILWVNGRRISTQRSIVMTKVRPHVFYLLVYTTGNMGKGFQKLWLGGREKILKIQSIALYVWDK
jgi:hypothetical protein